MSTGPGTMQRHIIAATAAHPGSWITITDLFDRPTAAQRESARRAMHRLAARGSVDVGTVREDVPVRTGYVWKQVDGRYRRTDEIRISMMPRDTLAVRARA